MTRILVLAVLLAGCAKPDAFEQHGPYCDKRYRPHTEPWNQCIVDQMRASDCKAGRKEFCE